MSSHSFYVTWLLTSNDFNNKNTKTQKFIQILESSGKHSPGELDKSMVAKILVSRFARIQEEDSRKMKRATHYLKGGVSRESRDSRKILWMHPNGFSQDAATFDPWSWRPLTPDLTFLVWVCNLCGYSRFVLSPSAGKLKSTNGNSQGRRFDIDIGRGRWMEKSCVKVRSY